jgi:hypothetical protein
MDLVKLDSPEQVLYETVRVIVLFVAGFELKVRFADT